MRDIIRPTNHSKHLKAYHKVICLKYVQATATRWIFIFVTFLETEISDCRLKIVHLEVCRIKTLLALAQQLIVGTACALC